VKARTKKFVFLEKTGKKLLKFFSLLVPKAGNFAFGVAK
jgi:hypothetical protein